MELNDGNNTDISICFFSILTSLLFSILVHLHIKKVVNKLILTSAAHNITDKKYSEMYN